MPPHRSADWDAHTSDHAPAKPVTDISASHSLRDLVEAGPSCAQWSLFVRSPEMLA